MVSQKKIAESLGVSRSTVAAILSGHGKRYSKKMQETVFNAAKGMGYHPDVAAQVIRKGINERTVAIVCDAVGTSNQLLSLGVIMGLNQESYDVMVFTGDDFEGIFRKIVSNRIRNVICIRLSDHAQEQCVNYARKYHLRMIMSMVKQKYEDFPAFNADFSGNMKILFRYLYGLGHRNIMLLHDGADNAWADMHRSCFHEEWTACSLPEEKLLHMDFRQRDKIIPNILKQETTAIICIYPGLALWIQEFLTARGVKVPEDISIVSYGDSKQCLELMPVPTITALREASGRQNDKPLIDYLVDYLHNYDPSLPVSSYTKFFPGDLVIRESSAKPPVKFRLNTIK